MRRFFATRLDGDRVFLSPDDARHIKNVLRLKIGDAIETVLPDKRVAESEIIGIEPDQVTAKVVSIIKTDIDHSPDITLLCGLMKGKKFDSVIRMACELGVVKIVPVVTKFCDVKPGGNTDDKTERWQKIAISAAKQSKANSVTSIEPICDIKSVEQYRTDLNIVCYEEAGSGLKPVLQSVESPRSITVFTGPEGGFATEEIDLLAQQGFKIASLGDKILRAETAPLCAVSSIIYHYSKTA